MPLRGAASPSRSMLAEARATFALGWPIILTNLAHMAMMTTDVVMLGWLGSKSLAAGTLGSNLYTLPMLFGLGLAQATSPMVAHVIGARRHSVRDVRRTVRQGLWAGAFLCLPAWLALWQAEAILLTIGQEPELAAEAARYVRVLQWGLLPMMGFYVLRSSLAALGRPRFALVASLIGVGANALGNYVLIFGHFGAPALGVVGSGLASFIASWVLFLVISGLCLYDRRLRRYALLGRWWRADWPRFRELMRLGLPISFALAFEVSVFNATVFLMGLLGSDSLAAHAIAMNVASLSFMVPMGLSQAATVRVGLAAGRRDPLAIGRAGWAAFVLGEGFMTAMALMLFFAPGPIVSLFLSQGDASSPVVAVLAAKFLAVAGLFQLVDGAQVLAGGMLRGLKDTRVPMIYAAVGYWVIGLPVGALLAFRGELGGVGLWGGLAAGLGSVAVLLLWRWGHRGRLGLVPYEGRVCSSCNTALTE